MYCGRSSPVRRHSHAPDARGLQSTPGEPAWNTPRAIVALPSPTPSERTLSAVVGDANDWTIRAVATLLTQNGFEVVRTLSAGRLVEEVRERRPDLVVVGSRLGELSGADACRVLRGMSSLTPATPLLLVTPALVSEEERVENLRAGVWDTIRLPANAEELLLRIRRYVDAKVASDEAREDRLVDPHTGFYNVRGLLRRAEEEASEAWRAKRPIACAIFAPDQATLDRFSADRTGEEQRFLAEQLTEVFRRLGRRSDVIGRQSDTTFIVVANATHRDGTHRMARRLLEGMSELRLPPLGTSGDDRAGILVGYHVPEPPPNSIPDPRDWITRAGGALMAARRDPTRAPITQWQTGDKLDSSFLSEAIAPTPGGRLALDPLVAGEFPARN